MLRYDFRKDNEAALRADIVRLASQYGRYGYRRIHALLQVEGWRVNHKRVERIWREEGLKIPQKQPKKGRLYLNEGSCLRLRPCWENHVWSYDFVADRLFNGKKIRLLTLIDEYTRKCLAIEVGYRLTSQDVLDTLKEIFIKEGLPDYIRSDNGSEFAKHEEISQALNVDFYFAHPYSSWERGLNENTNGLVRQYIKKGAELIDVTDPCLDIIASKLNDRPRKTLGYKTPKEVFHE